LFFKEISPAEYLLKRKNICFPQGHHSYTRARYFTLSEFEIVFSYRVTGISGPGHYQMFCRLMVAVA